MGPNSVIIEDCNNLGVVRHGNKPCHPLSKTQTYADVLRVLKQYIVHQLFALKFLYVASHAEDTKSWKDCSLKERIIIKVDLLAKKALQCAHVTDEFFDGQFSYEDFQINTNHI
jgi:hypothetical protein